MRDEQQVSPECLKSGCDNAACKNVLWGPPYCELRIAANRESNAGLPGNKPERQLRV